jgi:outer membrane biosynthesis protein TonB
MSDDLRDMFGDDVSMEAPEDELEGAPEESSNRIFWIATAGLGAILLIAIGLVLFMIFRGPGGNGTAQEAQAILLTNTAIVEQSMNGEPTETPPPTETEEPTATDTPEPTPTSTDVIKPTNTPTPVPPEEDGEEAPVDDENDETTENGEVEDGDEMAQAQPTATPTRQRRTPTPTRTPRFTPTPSTDVDRAPDTGVGEYILVIVAGLLVTVIIFARRLRQT